MLFYKHPKVVPKLNILVNRNPIDQVEDFNYLGITLDQHITWRPHIIKISIKISRVIGILRKLKRTFPQYIIVLLLIRIASFPLYCHIRNWCIHEINNHIVDLHL